jgi:hypothetical protein
MSDRENRPAPIGTPWWIYDPAPDYTQRRSGLQYDSPQDLIGRKDVYKYTLTTNDPATVSGHDAKVLR